ncbi:hypothetical protein O3G_MSEX013792 [Manduca sexta]|uniref:Uncharacterized protein n=1 Tax=Manduca sexta TaxID=7130 RepID=A0A921ZTU3_MANSE|nr:hypothetical protein O3G_MSEX013792 [Manduca sexta]KAG6463302.1 hypothetical protein O3G_MSEX013792 [Manduca sexta]
MKLFFIVSCVAILAISCSSPVNGDLNGFFGDIHKKVHHAGRGVGKLFKLENSDTRNEERIVFPDDDQDVAPRREQPKITTKAPTTEAPTTTTTAANTAETTTTKEGRENFAGGCATGFLRTADGRCKPTF